MWSLDSFLFLTKAGKSAITMRKKAKTTEMDSSKDAKIQGKEHTQWQNACCEFSFLFQRSISKENKASVLELHGSGFPYCLLIS